MGMNINAFAYEDDGEMDAWFDWLGKQELSDPWLNDCWESIELDLIKIISAMLTQKYQDYKPSYYDLHGQSDELDDRLFAMWEENR